MLKSLNNRISSAGKAQAEPSDDSSVFAQSGRHGQGKMINRRHRLQHGFTAARRPGQRSLWIGATLAVGIALAVTQPGPSGAYAASRSMAYASAFGHQDCTIVGTDGNDVITGTPGNDTICAGPGDDIIIGGGGSDTIYGDTGNDWIIGSNGAVSSDSGGDLSGGDELLGGPGNDTISGQGGPDWIEGNEGNDRIWAGSGDDTVWGDNVPWESDFAPGNDVIHGGMGNDELNGGAGNDQLYTGGNTVEDAAYGGDGNDLLVGSAPSFSDYLKGDAGNDVLIPDPLRLSPLGNDVSGGDGNDVIVTMNGMLDVYNTGNDISVPVSDACSVKGTAARDDTGNWSWTVECNLPFGKGLGDFSLGQDSGGSITGGATLANGLLSLSVSSWQKLLNGQVSVLTADQVLADPPAPPLFYGDESI